MQKWMLIDDDQIVTSESSLIADWHSKPDSLLWVDIEGRAETEDHDLLVKTLHLPEADVYEALLERHPPAFEADDKRLYLLMKPLDSESHTLDFSTQQMAIFTGNNFVVTRHNKELPYLHDLWIKVTSGERKLDAPFDIAFLMTKRMVKRYGKVLLDLEERLDVLEDELMEELNETHMQELVGYNTSAYYHGCGYSRTPVKGDCCARYRAKAVGRGSVDIAFIVQHHK